MNDAAKNPFGSTAVAERSARGVIEIEQNRVVAEVQAAMMIAKRFPRDPVKAVDLILQDCTRMSLAENATYDYARGGTSISAPSIRLAEVMAQRWGNIECGVKEISRHGGYSEAMTYAMDLETGFRDVKTFQVKHWRDTKQGGYQLTEERDIYELVANMGARRKRACILAVIPGEVAEAAVKQCDVTLNTKAEITPERLKSLLEKFAELSVTQAQIEARIQRRLEAITPALLVQLGKVYTSLKDGMSVVSDWFEATVAEGEAAKPKTGADALKAAAKTKAPKHQGGPGQGGVGVNVGGVAVGGTGGGGGGPDHDPTLGIPGAGDISHVGKPDTPVSGTTRKVVDENGEVLFETNETPALGTPGEHKGRCYTVIEFTDTTIKVEFDGAPNVTYEKLKAAIESRKDTDTLDADATLIGEIPDHDRQNELAKLYQKRRKELKAKSE